MCELEFFLLTVESASSAVSRPGLFCSLTVAATRALSRASFLLSPCAVSRLLALFAFAWFSSRQIFPSSYLLSYLPRYLLLLTHLPILSELKNPTNVSSSLYIIQKKKCLPKLKSPFQTFCRVFYPLITPSDHSLKLCYHRLGFYHQILSSFYCS